MKIVCIKSIRGTDVDRDDIETELTVGKIYTHLFPTDLPPTIQFYYKIVNNNGKVCEYATSLFVSLDKYRKEQLNKLI